jgi:hypothetical protein
MKLPYDIDPCRLLALFPFDAWRHGRSAPIADREPTGKNDPKPSSPTCGHCDLVPTGSGPSFAAEAA